MKKRESVMKIEENLKTSNNSTKRTVTIVKYGICQKNYGVRGGEHVVDGCGEFLANGKEGTVAALTCAVCGCHRNFHEKETHTKVVCDCSYDPSSSGS